MIHLPVHRNKGCTVLGAPAPGLAGPFGTWTWEPDDDDPDHVGDVAGPATAGSEERG